MVKCFLAVAEKSSVTQAAETLFIARQYVSKQIIRLEEELGSELFIRAHNSMLITRAGLIWFEYFTKIQHEYSKVRERCASIKRDRPTFRIGLPAGMMLNELILQIRGLCEAFDPDSLFIWEYHSRDRMQHLLNNGKLDLIVALHVIDLTTDSFLRQVLYKQIDQCFCLSKKHPRASAKDWTELKGLPYLATMRPGYSAESLNIIIHELSNTWGLEFGEVKIMPDYDATLSALEIGEGIVVSNAEDRAINCPGIKCYYTDKKLCSYFVWREDNLTEISQYVVKQLCSGVSDGDVTIEQN